MLYDCTSMEKKVKKMKKKRLNFLFWYASDVCLMSVTNTSETYYFAVKEIRLTRILDCMNLFLKFYE